jgi:hypothetical protein
MIRNLDDERTLRRGSLFFMCFFRRAITLLNEYYYSKKYSFNGWCSNSINQQDWTSAVDAFERALPSSLQVPAREERSNRFIGIFYFLWLGQHGVDGPYDNTKILEQAPEAVTDPAHPLWGPQEAFHFWGEPLYGYYLNDDAWVLRKHVQLLTSAGGEEEAGTGTSTW